MPWDITVKRADALPLGTPEDVQQQIISAFPGVSFYRDPSGAEKLASLPAGVEMPDLIKKHWEAQPPALHADLNRRGYSLRFYLGAVGAETVTDVAIEARGSTRAAVPMMEALTSATGWVIVDDRGNILVENGRAIPEAK